MDFASLVSAELRRARNGHKPINSLHEGFAVLYEEVDELWDEVRKKPDDRNRGQVLAELIQIAAMARRIAEDLDYV